MSDPMKFYFCDRKPGACKSWEKYGWKECMNPDICRMISNKDHCLVKDGKEVPPVFSCIPDGWKILEGAVNAPRGMRFISNGKSRFDENYEVAFVPEVLV